MPLTINDCGYMADVLNENLLGEDPGSSDYKYFKALAKRFEESYETGIIVDDNPLD